MVFWNSGSWVLGVQLATTTLLSLSSLIFSLIFSCVSWEHVYRFCSAYTTLGSVLAYSATSGTFTTPPMLTPQWHTNTPILGSCPSTLISFGYSFFVVSVFLAAEMTEPALAAAPEASATVIGMSFGDENAPLTNMPGLDVSTGVNAPVCANPSSLSLNFMILLRFSASAGGLSPTARTTIWNSSSLGSPPSTYFILRFFVFGSSLIAATLERTNLMPHSFAARL